MAEPLVVDIRSGITDEVLAGLRKAERVVIGVKAFNTAAIGYWVDDELRVALIHCVMSRMIRVPRTPDMRFEMAPTLVSRVGDHFLPGLLVDISDAQRNDLWSRALGVLREGDVLRIAPDPNAARVPCLQVQNKSAPLAGAPVASVRLPIRGAARGK